MITASSAYMTASAKLTQVPIFALKISGYYRVFGNRVLTDALGTVTLSAPGAWQTPVTVLGTTMPWNSADPSKPYYVTAAGTSPVLIPCTLGMALELEYVSGLIFLDGITQESPDGGPGNSLGGIFRWPSDAYGIPSNDGELAGAFVDGSGLVLLAFRIGSASVTPPAPAGTANLSIGVNTYEDWSDNTGSWLIRWRQVILTDVPVVSNDWLISIEDHQTTVNELDGGTDLADLIFTVQDRDGAITGDFPFITFEGKTVTLLQGYPGMALADFVTLLTGRIDDVESSNNNLEYVFTCPDIRADLAQTIYKVGDDGFATSTKHPRTLLGHPLNILLSALETECRYSSAQVDEAKIVAYRDGVYSGQSMKFTLTAAPIAKDFIELEILKALGAYLRTNNLGKITIEFFYPITSASVFDFNATNLLEIPVAGQADLINEVVLRLDEDAGNNFDTEKVFTYLPSIEKYGLFGAHTIEGKGLRSGLNGIFLGLLTAFMIFLRYGLKALCHGNSGKNTSSNPINAIWSAALIEPGDYVTVTHPQVPDKVRGVMGITARSYVAMDRNYQFFHGNVQLKLLAVDLSAFTQYLITPDGEASYTAASSGDQRSMLFLASDGDQYSNGDPAHTLC